MSTIIMNVVIIMAIILCGACIIFMLATLIFSSRKKNTSGNEEKRDVQSEINDLEARQKAIYSRLLAMTKEEKKEEERKEPAKVEEKAVQKVEETVVEEKTVEKTTTEEVREETVVETFVQEVTEVPALDEPVIEQQIVAPQVALEVEKKKNPSKRRSFALKLASSTEATKRYFSEITNRLRYYGLTARIGKSKVMFRANKEVYARMFFKGKRIVLALPLNPADEKYDPEIYKQIDLSTKKGFEEIAFGIRIANKKSLELINSLIDEVVAKFDFKPNNKFKEIDYVEKYPDTYTYFEKLGYGYLIRQEVRREDAEIYADDFADKIVIEKKLEDKKPSRFLKSEISIQEFNNRYTDVDTPVDMDRLKASELIAKNSNYLVVKAISRIDKPFKVYAHEFEPDAVKMIFMAGGEAYKLVYSDDENK